jgi:histo-blood group ABO system transferase
MDASKSIALLIIATNKYIDFATQLIESADKFFLTKFNVEYILFTDHHDLTLKSDRKINIIRVNHKPWPWMTLGRYQIFQSKKEKLLNYDYLFYCDADMKFCDIVGPEILSDRVATQHPGYCGTRGTPETDPNSLACVFEFEDMQYFAGGFNGGKSTEYIKMSETLSNNINKDINKNIIAVWHDESHMNRYFIDNPPTRILDPGYCYGESLKPPFTPRLLALDKDHNEIRK